MENYNLEEHDESEVNLEGETNKLTRNSYIDTEENIDQHSVTWRNLCGYFAVTFYVKTKEDSIQLFKALKLITDYEVS